MPKEDSMNKLIPKYFPAYGTSPFTYEDSTGQIIKTRSGENTFNPLPAKFSVDYFKHGWKCTLGCGGCCPSFSKDWPPYEYDKLPDWVKKLCVVRHFKINGKPVKIHSIFDDKDTVQIIHEKEFCQFLDTSDHRDPNHQIGSPSGKERRTFNAGSILGCGIHKLVVGGIGNPLSCTLPLLDFDPSEKFGATYISEQRMSGGGIWSDRTLLPILKPKTKGVRCREESFPNEQEDREKIERLKEFIDYCGIPVRGIGSLLST
jgi:hypothetical protein